MGLETSTYVNGLNANNPAATDGLAQADDHLRLIKSTIKNTFPSLTGAVTADQDELNALTDTEVTTSDITKLVAVTASADDLNKLSSLATTAAQLGYLSSLSSNVQEQLDTKAPAENAVLTGDTTATSINIGAFSIYQSSEGRLTVNVGDDVLLSLDTTGNLRVKSEISAFDTSA